MLNRLLLLLFLNMVVVTVKSQTAQGVEAKVNLIGDLIEYLVKVDFRSCSITSFGETEADTVISGRLIASAWNHTNPVQRFLGIPLPGTVQWRYSLCDVVFLYVSEESNSALETYLSDLTDADEWNYNGKVILILTKAGILEIARSLTILYKLRKTNNLLILRPSETTNEVELWTSWFYSWKTLRTVGNFRHGRLRAPNGLFPEKHRNLQGYPIRVYTFPHPPAIFGTQMKNQTLSVTTGVDAKFIRTLAHKLNFTVQWVHPGPELWGSLLDNGTYTGLMGKISNEEGDIGVAHIFINHFRTRFIQYSRPYNFEKACFITPSPKEKPRWTSLVGPFSLEVWIGVILALLLLTLVFREFARPLYNTKTRNFFSNSGSLLYSVSIFTLNNVEPVDLPLLSLRTLLLFVQLMGFVISVSYSGNLTAHLTIKSYEPPIKTFAQLDAADIKIVGYTNFWYEDFKTSSNKYLKNLANKYETGHSSVFYHIVDVANGHSAFISDLLSMVYVQLKDFTTRDGTSPVRVQEECQGSYNVGAVLNKNSPLKKSLDNVIKGIYSGGLMLRYFKEVLLEKVVTKEPGEEGGKESFDIRSFERTDSNVLSIDHLQSAFYILGFGCFVSLITFLAEVAAVCLMEKSNPSRPR